MARATFTDIVDGRVDAYSPASARLVTDFRDNLMTPTQWSLSPNGLTGEDLTPSASYETLATLRLYLPDWMNGTATSGARLILSVYLYLEDAGNTAAATYKITDGTDSSNEESLNLGPLSGGSDSATRTFTLDFNPSAGVTDILFQAKETSSSVADSYTMTWETTSVAGIVQRMD